MMRCVVIDDEPLARECITDYVAQVDFLELVDEGSNPIELASILEKEKVDLIFLDIQMPLMNGVDYLKTAKDLPMVIFTTAYPSYALEGYQLDVMDYLLKPITFDRFFKAVSKAKEYYDLTNPSNEIGQEAEDFFFVKCNSKFEKIHLDSILYIQAMQNYVTIHTTEGKYMALLTMKNMEEKLNGAEFIRVHKSYIVAKSKVTGLENHELVIQDIQIPVSRTYRKEVMEEVLGDKLW